MSGVATSYMDGKGSRATCCMQSSHILTKVSWNCVIKESGAPQLHGSSSSSLEEHLPKIVLVIPGVIHLWTCFVGENALWLFPLLFA